jgi:hypothetical protein
MKFSSRLGTRRWTGAVLVACGAITFAATNGFSYTRRLYVYAWATGGSPCNLAYPSEFYGLGEVHSVFAPACEVTTPAAVGTTNQGNTECNIPDWASPKSMAKAVIMDTTTGDVSIQATGADAVWGSTSSISYNHPGGCTVNVNATGL